MNIRRSWLFFLVMLLLSACCILLLAEKPIMENLYALRGLPDGSNWQVVGVGNGKLAAAAGWRDDALVLRYFSTDGQLRTQQSIAMPEDLIGGAVAQIVTVREGMAYVGLYGPNAEKLYLYRIRGEDAVDRLLAQPCSGDFFAERVSRTALSELSYEDGILSFAVLTDGTLECYICRDSGGLEPIGKYSDRADASHALSILSLQDGTLLLGGTGSLMLGGKQSEAVFNGQAVTHLTQGRGGWYYIDAAGMDLYFTDATLSATYRVLHLNPEWNGVARSVISATLMREEGALMLLDGSILTLTNADGTRELTGVLRPSELRAGLELAKYAAITLAAAALLWLLLCGVRRGYASLVVFRGGAFVAAALLCFTALRFFVLIPMQNAAALRENEAIVSNAVQITDAARRMNDASLPSDVCRILEEADAQYGRNVCALIAEMNADGWKAEDGRDAAMLPGFSPTLVDAASAQGSAGELRDGMFRYARAEGNRCLCIQIGKPYEGHSADLFVPLLAVFGALALLALVILLSVGVDLRRISKKMERISHGDVPERLALRTGDELESMASIVNSLGESMKEQEAARERVERSYRRFVPEKVLALLGKNSIQEVDKSAFAARRMAVMTVWFAFPETLYTDMNHSRLLFDSVNEVIERTASIVARKGGTVFHFAYNGFDAVMDEDGEAVSTAVAIQQEILSFNELRAQNRLPGVTLRIALDKGDVMLGIVGDTAQMEPTTISSSLSTVQELIDLGNRLKAGILCTEAIIMERREYGNRYMGKCVVGNRNVRVYEVFDGDEFTVRRGKASSLSDFSKGVYDLYGGDAAGAKHTFLQLAHNYPLDGGARYYLYLADRLEHDPSLPCVLNVDTAAEGEM